MQLPERFKAGPQSKVLAAYISKRYSKYGFPLGKHVEYNPEWTPEGSRERYRWVEKVSHGLRVVGTVQEIAKREGYRIDHNGWFIDSFQDETTCGTVYQLPAKDGKPQYVPANSDPHNSDCAVLDFHSITDDLHDAVRWADSMAESYAEKEREFQAKQNAESRIEEIQEEIRELYSDFRNVCREYRANKSILAGMPSISGLIAQEWSDTKRKIQKLRATRAKIEDNFWYAVEGR